MLSAIVLATKEGDVDCGVVIFGLCLYRVVGLVVDNVDQDHVVGNLRMNLTRGSVCNGVDCFGSKIDKPDEARERIGALNNPLGRLLANGVRDVGRLTKLLARRLVDQIDPCLSRAKDIERYLYDLCRIS